MVYIIIYMVYKFFFLVFFFFFLVFFFFLLLIYVGVTKYKIIINEIYNDNILNIVDNV